MSWARYWWLCSVPPVVHCARNHDTACKYVYDAWFNWQSKKFTIVDAVAEEMPSDPLLLWWSSNWLAVHVRSSRDNIGVNECTFLMDFFFTYDRMRFLSEIYFEKSNVTIYGWAYAGEWTGVALCHYCNGGCFGFLSGLKWWKIGCVLEWFLKLNMRNLYYYTIYKKV